MKGELFSKHDLSQIEGFMRVAIAEAKEAKVHGRRTLYACLDPLFVALLNPRSKK